LAAIPLAYTSGAGIDGQPLAALTDFGRGLSRGSALTPLGVNAEFVFDAAEALFERAGDGRGNTAGMPVETEDTVERLEPEWIG
jgi:hypothetical protein